MTETVTATELGKLLGTTTRTITDLAKRDIIVRAGRGYDRVVSDGELDAVAGPSWSLCQRRLTIGTLP